MNTPAEYVDWFRGKFKSPYSDSQWLTCRNDQLALINRIMYPEHAPIHSVLELGTWVGYTTLMFWLCPGVTQVSSMDIADSPSNYQHPFHVQQERAFYGRYVAHTPVELLIGTTQSIPAHPNRWDMIFIDADHSYEWVKQDTLWALACNPKLICWHDRHNGNPGVDKWLDEYGLATLFPDSSVAFQILG